MNIDELHQLVERKMETIKTLESLLEKEDAELVELEVKLESLEEAREQESHEPARRAQKTEGFRVGGISTAPIDKLKSQ